MARIIISSFAESDLTEIWQYIANDNEEAADKIIRNLSTKFHLLSENKEIGVWQDEFAAEMRRFAFKNYNIYYLPIEDGIEIYRVLHASRNGEQLFSNFPGEANE